MARDSVAATFNGEIIIQHENDFNDHRAGLLNLIIKKQKEYGYKKAGNMAG